jgi:hypothetical protein
MLCAGSLSLFMTGCGSGNEQALKVKIADLESENLALKTELVILKDSFAKAQTAQLKAAFQPMEEALTKAKQQGNSSEVTARAATQSASQLEAENRTTPKEPAPFFSDLTKTPTASLITDLAKLGIFGDTQGKFFPNRAITRGEYAQWLYKAYNALEPEAKQIRTAPQLAPIFRDLPTTHPQYKYIQALANAGYSIGYEDHTFKPDKPLTREEMLGIKVGVDVGKTLEPWRSQMDTVWKFSDGKQVDERFTGYINQDYYVSGPKGSNIQRAFGSIGALHPKQAVLRYEAAATLWQIGQFGDTQNTNVAAVLHGKAL